MVQCFVRSIPHGGPIEQFLVPLCAKKRTNINELYLDIWLFTNSQFIEIVHKIINWYMKNAKSLFVSVI